MLNTENEGVVYGTEVRSEGMERRRSDVRTEEVT